MFIESPDSPSGGVTDHLALRQALVDFGDREWWPRVDFVFDPRFCDDPIDEASAVSRSLLAIGVTAHPRPRGADMVIMLDLEDVRRLMEAVPDLGFGPDGERGRAGWQRLMRATPTEARRQRALEVAAGVLA